MVTLCARVFSDRWVPTTSHCKYTSPKDDKWPTVRSLVLNPLIGYIQDSEEPVHDLFCVEDHRLLPAPGVGCIKLNQERVLPTSGSGNRELSALRVVVLSKSMGRGLQ